MPLTDKQIIEKFRIRPNDRILDIGGSMKQHPVLSVDTLVDIVRPEESPYSRNTLKAKRFVRVDITKDRLPFSNREFDFVICTHTLEDLYNPFLLINEMSRVAKRGLIITPSFGSELVFSHFNLTDWLTGARRVPGLAHHKWLLYLNKNVMCIVPKNYPLLYTHEFQITKWRGEEEFKYYWEGQIKYKEIKDLDFHLLVREYKDFIKRNRSNIEKGPVLFYFDNPIYYFKEVVKLFLKRGEGFGRLKK